VSAAQGQHALIFDAPPLPPVAARRAHLRWLEVLALVYLVAISAGVFGFVDIVVFGRDFEKTDESEFARALWPIAYLLFAIVMSMHARPLLAAARRCWWVLPFPALAFSSVLWSIDPQATFDAAVRIAATTVIGLYLGARFESGVLAKVVFVVLFVAIGVSILSKLGGLAFAEMKDGTVRGLFFHKNMFGSRGALLVAAALALLFAGWRPWLTLPGVIMGAIAALWSSSASGLVLAAIAAIVAPFALAVQGSRTGMALRLIGLAMLLCAGAFALVLLRVDPIAEVLQALERDATLTGRWLLWEAGFEEIARRPLFGAGYDAFWPAGLNWRMFGVIDELGYVLHFHNSFVQVAVDLGALGLLAALVQMLGYGGAALRALRRIEIPLWPALFGAMTLALGLVEYELFVKHNLFHILFVAIAVAALREVEQPDTVRSRA
jgi:exopolysaccharide production protein ExoQ